MFGAIPICYLCTLCILFELRSQAQPLLVAGGRTSWFIMGGNRFFSFCSLFISVYARFSSPCIALETTCSISILFSSCCTSILSSLISFGKQSFSCNSFEMSYEMSLSRGSSRILLFFSISREVCKLRERVELVHGPAQCFQIPSSRYD